MYRNITRDVISFIEWIVYKVLIGDREALSVVYRYCVENKTPREISRELNISEIRVEHIVRYAMYLIKNRFLCMDILRVITIYIDEIQPIAHRLPGGNYECKLCGKVFRPAGIVQHVKNKHIDLYRDLVDMLVRIYWERRGSA